VGRGNPRENAHHSVQEIFNCGRDGPGVLGFAWGQRRWELEVSRGGPDHPSVGGKVARVKLDRPEKLEKRAAGAR